MNPPDLITMIGNLSRSLYGVQHLISGLGYVIAIMFFIMGLGKLKKIAESRGHSQENPFVPMAYFLAGGVLLYLPDSFKTLSNTVFGAGNILSYAQYNPYNIYSSMGLLIQTAGLIWFIRGCVLLVHSSEPGEQKASKGLVFVGGGILAMNFTSTIAAINTVMGYIESFTMSIKSTTGY